MAECDPGAAIHRCNGEHALIAIRSTIDWIKAKRSSWRENNGDRWRL
jgi:hypothetical protein